MNEHIEELRDALRQVALFSENKTAVELAEAAWLRPGRWNTFPFFDIFNCPYVDRVRPLLKHV